MALLTPYWILDGVLVLLSSIVAAYAYMTRNFKYWANRGVTEIRPTPFFGNFGELVFKRKSISEFLKNFYEKGKGLKYVGVYVFDRPILLVRDPLIIKDILVRRFNDFDDRFSASSDDDTMGSANLFLLKNPHWKMLRSKLTPVFSSAKIKNMFHLMIEVSEDLDVRLETLDLRGEGRVIDLKETCARFTTDVIGSCAFGLKVNSLNNPDSEFRECGRRIFGTGYRRSVELAAIFFAPGLVKPLSFKAFEKYCTDFLRRAIWAAIAARTESGERRNDLIDTLIELKKSQTETEKNDPRGFKFDGDNLVAQAAVFFSAGFETSSTMMAFATYELALQPDIQKRLRLEIISALDENGGQISYEMVRDLDYLDMVVSETLRKYPILPYLDRVAARDYEVPGSELVVEKGTPVFVVTSGLHYDPEYFPDPRKFDPERFNEANKQKIPSYVYMPFGEGPHNCIGLRFGLMQAKLGLVRIFSNYEVTTCERTPIPMRFDPRSVLISPLGGLYLNVRKVDESTSRETLK